MTFSFVNKKTQRRLGQNGARPMSSSELWQGPWQSYELTHNIGTPSQNTKTKLQL